MGRINLHKSTDSADAGADANALWTNSGPRKKYEKSG